MKELVKKVLWEILKDDEFLHEVGTYCNQKLSYRLSPQLKECDAKAWSVVSTDKREGSTASGIGIRFETAKLELQCDKEKVPRFFQIICPEAFEEPLECMAKYLNTVGSPTDIREAVRSMVARWRLDKGL